MKWIAITLLFLSAVAVPRPLPAVDEQRQAYDRMVEKATNEADEYLQEKKKEQQASQTEAQSQHEVAIEERVEAERGRIEAEMDAVRERGFSATFTQGMRDNLLRQLQDRLDQLMSDPESYFGGE